MFNSCLPQRGANHAGFSTVTDVEIYFGTMFGSAERYARALAYDVSTQRRVRVTVHDLDGFDSTTFARRDRLQATRMFVFVVSTHFAGAPPPSAERFRNWINDLVANPYTDATAPGTGQPPAAASSGSWVGSFSSRRRHPLAGMQFAVFGIGDSVYLTFNAMGKFVDLKLKHLGATRVCAIGLGDCSNDLDGTFKSWEAALMRKLPLRMSTTQPLGLNFVSAYSTATTGRRLSTTPYPVVPTANSPTANDSTAQKQARVKTRVAPEQRLDTPPQDSIPGSSTPSARLCVRDNFGRTVRLRFLCETIALGSEQQPIRQLAQTPAPPGPRTPRVALFDTRPFAEIEVVECVGDTPSSVSSGSPTPSSASSRHGTRHQKPVSRSAMMRVRLLNPEISYTTVSTLAIFPQNSADHVEQIAHAFGYDLDAVIQLVVDDSEETSTADLPRHQEFPFPTPCTIRTALAEFLELRNVTRELLHVASGFVVTTDEHELLEKLSSTDGASAFKAQIVDQSKGLVDILDIVPTLQIPLEVLVNFVSPIRPRYYTIASSPRVASRDIEIAVSLGRVGRPQGLAVSYFEQVIAANRRVPCRGFISYSRFVFQDDYSSPLILIAMGVSVSAMRSVIVNRLVWLFQNQEDAGGGGKGALPPSMPKHILFMGAANEETLVYQDDLRHWEQQMFVKVHYAYSNDPRFPRQYVQDAVAGRMDEIYQAVKQSNGTRILVSGRVTMVKRLREIFEADQARRGNAWFDSILASGRFIDEAFI